MPAHKARKFITSVTILCFGLSLFTVFAIPTGASMVSSYHQLKTQYPTFVDRITAAEATEAQIEAVLNDLDYEVQSRGPLTDANFNSVMYQSLQTVLDKPKHGDFMVAMLTAFPDEIDYTLEKGELHPGLVPLRNAVKTSLLPGGNTGITPGGGGGGNLSQDEAKKIAVLIKKELNSFKDYLVLSTAEQNLKITGDSLQEVAQAGKELRINVGKLQFIIPAGVIQVEDDVIVRLEARPLSKSENEQLAAAMPEEFQMIGPVWELNISRDDTGKSLSPGEAITVIVPYTLAELGDRSADNLTIVYYNENTEKWQKINSSQVKDQTRVSFSTRHLSKYAIAVLDAESEKDEPEKVTGECPFIDLDGHWAKDEITAMVNLGLVSGVSPSNFAPQQQVTRAEFAALLVRALHIKPAGHLQGRFTDVAAASWYFKEVNAAAQAGLVSGLTADTFAPNQPVTREQMAVMISRALNRQGKASGLTSTAVDQQLSSFRDEPYISAWARAGVAQAVAAGIVKGRSADSFAPSATATRAEAAAMIWRMYKTVSP